VEISVRSASPVPERPLDWDGTERYEIVQCLGRGGMGAVYEARDRRTGQLLALKTLLHATPAALYLFKQEFRTLSDVDHPNLVRLHELVMTESDRVFFTMELVRGTDFVAYVRRPDAARGSMRPRAASIPEASGTRVTEGRSQVSASDSAGLEREGARRHRPRSPADFERLRPALRQLVEGVMALHAGRKLHRDLKPSNVLVTPEGRVVVLDFGVATEVTRVVDEEMRDEDNPAVGTAAYMAPEQAFEEPSPACDWYAVGAMLYEAIVGRPPFSGAVLDVLSMKATVDPLAPSERVEGVPADLEALCRALLHREPAMRPSGHDILVRLGAAPVDRADFSPGAAVAPSSGALPIGLTGRAGHLRALREAFETTLSGTPVTLRIRGPSGMGKTVLAHRFLDELVEQGKAVVLRGRVHERESVPYKAVDGLVDALSRYLMCLKDDDLTIALPRDTWALARLFPVLLRVPGIGAMAGEPVTDPLRVRRRAFLALRELLSSLARRRPIVLLIDDAQWGDTDSAALVLEVMRPPFAPPVLLAMTYRQEEEATSVFLRELAARWPEASEARSISVGPLGLEDARRLALGLVGSQGPPAEAAAAAIARESGGSPFLVQELARDLSSETGLVAHVPTGAGAGVLESMVNARVERLPDDARELLEIVAVCGRPVTTSLVIEAAGGGPESLESIAQLRARRFVRASLRGGREVVEVQHGPIREMVVARIPPSRVQLHHGRLAAVLEGKGDSDVEAVAEHLLGAGQRDRAAQFAERASEQAASALAFDRAAQLLRLTIEAQAPLSADGVRLRKRLGEVLEWAGRSAEAGRVYLEAAEAAPPLQRLDLQRAAAEQLHVSGLMDEGTQVLYRVLAATGLRAPASQWSAFAWYWAYRLWLWVFGARFRAREVGPDERLRLDALYAVAVGFALVDHILSISVKARVLVSALRAGDRLHASRSAALVASEIGGRDGGPQPKTARALDALAEKLADEAPDRSAKVTVKLLRGVTSFLRGDFAEAKAILDPIQAMATNRRAGQQSALLFTLASIHYMGDLKDLTERYNRALVEADERGNRFVSVAVRSTCAAAVWLSADDPDRARRELHEAMAQWAQSKFNNQKWRATLHGVEVDLYVGYADTAYERARELSRAVRENFFESVHYVRVLTTFVLGRAAIASRRGFSDRERRRRGAEARRCARSLEREGTEWTSALASILRAGLAASDDDLAAAATQLRAAISHAESAHLAMHAAAARLLLGKLLGGVEGGILVRVGEEAMTARGVAVPERYAAMLVPGLR